MATTKVTKDFNGEQLVAELEAAGYVVDSDFPSQEGDELTVEGDFTDQQLANALETHVPDLDFGKDPEEKDLDAIRTKAQAVYDGTDTFTATQIQKILAAIVLRATR